jgi:hypothetical protein
MKYVIIGIFILISGCKPVQQLAQERAARKAAQEEAARQEHLRVLAETRAALPCVPVGGIIKGITQYLPGEKIPCPDNGTGKRDSVKCPATEFRVDTAKILDMVGVQQYKDSLKSYRYYLQLATDTILKKDAQLRQVEAKVLYLNEKIKDKNKHLLWAYLGIAGLGVWSFRKPLLMLITKIPI